ncbi:anti-phage ZorAB system protein ZorA [Caballeronia sp. LZ035]|uniref:anti-phage ZorAB system protein ZorA n=1 Tax=Caballeronia sp. LZ035 TaxID=3038568 RepID=UPI00285BE081|nr:anti-phage ZorAB system protein ZorA [Caballeronia sp. LZ035]MDR5761471.1 anti-phage ZorAB system protein ZorA [Caballeronia sp. LZ035]
MNLSSDSLSHFLHYFVFISLSVAFVLFLWQFVLPFFRVRAQLLGVTRAIAALKSAAGHVDADQIGNTIRNEALRHCWDEYRDTLHAQKMINASGVTETGRWRATAIASTFFTEQALINAPLRTEFYKHLPGILTGIGIIGTFGGLILGLNDFKITDDPLVVRTSLESLVASVGGAFKLSGLAIVLAMFITTVEKSMINKLYTHLDLLCGLIDGLFESGAGEEYLQRLVEASETSATQAMQMKESLVTDLKQVLGELTQQQIQAMRTTSSDLGASITNSLSEGLAEPLARISNAVQSVGNSQGEAVSRILTDVLSSFTAQMENMFGSQLRGMNEMLLKTANTIESASQGFGALAAQIQDAGTGAADAMARRVEEALGQIQSRQSEANAQMQAFVDSLKDSVARGQAESADLTQNMLRQMSESTASFVKTLQDQNQASHAQAEAQQSEANARMRAFVDDLKDGVTRGQAESADMTRDMLRQMSEGASSFVKELQEQNHASHADAAARQARASEQMHAWMEATRVNMAKGQSEATEASSRLIGQLGDKASEMIDALKAQTSSAHEEHGRRQAQLAAQIADLLDKQTSQIDKVTLAVQQGSLAMSNAIDKLNAATQGNIERMGQGAERLHDASTRFADNLQGMKAATDGVANTAERFSQAAASLDGSLGAVQQALADQRTVRDTLAGMVTELRTVIETVSSEATLKRDLVQSMEQAGKSLREAQDATRGHLDDLIEDLAEVHQEFADQVRKTLRESNSAFHSELAQATGLLKSAIVDLGDVFDRLPAAA